MGVYILTRCSEVRVVDGIKVGVMKFAYKDWGYREPPAHAQRGINAKHRAAERAAIAEPDVQLFVLQDWKLAPGITSLEVRSFGKGARTMTDDRLDCQPVVGHVRKVGRAWTYEPLPEVVAVTVSDLAGA